MALLTAKKALRYAGRSLLAGDEFEATGKDARLLIAIGKAVAAGEVTKNEARAELDLHPIEAPTVEPASDPTAAPKGKYKTRRLTANE